MELKSLSASSMLVWEACPARYVADRRAGRLGQSASRPAQIGSICHGAQQYYVQKVYIDKTAPEGKDTLEACFMVSYKEVMGNLDPTSSEYTEAWGLSFKWMRRTDFTGRTVISVEQKQTYMVKYKYGEVKFTFIIDRLDQIGPDEYEVVDYKSLQAPLSKDALREKLQARVYALMVQILYPNAKRIWVSFDMLRWEGDVSTSFNREDNIATYRRIQRAAAEIYEANEDEVPERLNSECHWCIRKTDCAAVQANIKAGGVLRLESLPEMADLRALLDFQRSAADAAVKDLDNQILNMMQKMGEVELQTELTDLKLKVKGARSVDSRLVQELMDRKEMGMLLAKYMNENITMKDFDALLNDPDLPGDVRKDLESLIVKSYSNPRVDTQKRSF
jgi:hypothetical protein